MALLHGAPKVEVLNPHFFSGRRDAKEIHNYSGHTSIQGLGSQGCMI